MVLLTIKAKPVVEPLNYAVHDEGKNPGGVITISSPRCLYSEIRGWLGAGGRVRECRGSGAVICFPGAIYSEALGWGAGVFALLAFRLCNSLTMQRKKGGINEVKKLRNNFDHILFLHIRAKPEPP